MCRIDQSCQRVGRRKEEVQLVAVTKTVPAEMITEAVRSGIKEIGESRVQESLDKYQTIHSSFPSLRWHMVGHLQRNKVNRAVELFDCIQSVDSTKLIEAIDRRASELGKIQDCLVEVKVSDEPSKQGLPPEELSHFMQFCSSLKNVRLNGMMILAPYFDNAEQVRPYFKKAKEIYDQFFIQHPILSMGMSSDFEIAIEEGSNMVRIGTALFGVRSA